MEQDGLSKLDIMNAYHEGQWPDVLGDSPVNRIMSGDFPFGIKKPEDAEWGEYVLPHWRVNANRGCTSWHHDVSRNSDAIRVAIFGSFSRGYHVLGRLKELEKQNPDLVQIVGLATDDVLDSDSRITKKRRVWQYIQDETYQMAYQYMLMGMATNHGVPVYTGKVKSNVFQHHILPHWRPDVSIMSTFGQLINRPIYNAARYGMYNLHPSHLAEGKFPGGNPFNEMLDAGEYATRVSLHHVNKAFDEGHVVGFSPEVSIETENDYSPDRGELITRLHDKTGWVAGKIAEILVKHVHEKMGTPLSHMHYNRWRVWNLDLETPFTNEEREYLDRPIHKIAA